MKLTQRLTNQILKLVNSEIASAGHDVVATKIVDTTKPAVKRKNGVNKEIKFMGDIVDDNNTPCAAWAWVVEGKHPALWSCFAIYTKIDGKACTVHVQV